LVEITVVLVLLAVHSRVPSIKMTNEAPWNPSTVGCEKRALIGNVKIDAITINCERPDEPQLQMHEAEYDILMASCSAVYSDRTLIQRLVSSVNIASCVEDEEADTVEPNVARKAAAIDTRARHTALSIEEVSRKFGVGLETARQTLKVTTQNGIRHAVHPLSRRYRTDIMQSRQQRLNATFYTDTMFSQESPRKHVCPDVYQREMRTPRATGEEISGRRIIRIND
jgi:hypothetical protein